MTRLGHTLARQREQDMADIVQPRNGGTVTLRPCPAWCSLSEHFTDGTVIDADDGFHHYGPEITVPTSDRLFTNGPESVVKVSLKAWTKPLDAEPEPARVDLQLENADSCVDLTPAEARTVAVALLQMADTAERTGKTETRLDTGGGGVDYQ